MKLHAAAAAINTTPLDWAGNRERHLHAFREADAAGIQIVVAPELGLSGYGCEDYFFNQSTITNAWLSLEKIAGENLNLLVTVGLPIEFEGSLYNAVAVIHGNEIKGLYCKQNLAGDGVHYEGRWFKPWPAGKTAILYKDGVGIPVGDLLFHADPDVRLGFEICEDAWVADRPGIRLAKSQVDLILNPSASHFAIGKTKTREGFVVEGSRAFTCGYIYANLLGNEAGRIIYDGDCLIANNGTLIAKGPRFGFVDHRLTSAVIDLSLGRTARRKSVSYKGETRDSISVGQLRFHEGPKAEAPPAPAGVSPIPVAIDEFIQAESLALFDYARKSHTQGFVISLSGGADSALCAILIHKMVEIGTEPLNSAPFHQAFGLAPEASIAAKVKKILYCIYQATENSSKATADAAQAVADAVGADFENVNVQDDFVRGTEFLRHYLQTHKQRDLSWAQDDVTLQNLQARVRALRGWIVANTENRLLITTSNRSEAAVGYATMDGDTAGSIGPLGGVSKEFILVVLDYLAAGDGALAKAIQQVRQKAPSAELKPAGANQTDEKDLMPYPILDRIEKMLIIERKSPGEIAQETDIPVEHIRKFATLFPKAQWKRERYAPSFHIQDRNLDPRSYSRLPILSQGFEEELHKLRP